MATGYGVSSTSLNGCVLYFDAANPKSYPGAGTSWLDLSGNNNNGTLTNGPLFNNLYGGCIQTDGVNDYISVAHNSTLNFGTGDFTILMWVSGITTYPGCVKTLLWKGASFANNNAGYTVGTWACNPQDMYMIVADGSTSLTASTLPNFSMQAWNGVKLVGLTRIGNTVYQINNSTLTSLGTFSGNVNNSSTMYLGYEASAFNNYISCKYHAVQIFNRALSQSDLNNIFAATRNRYFGTLPFAPSDISGLQLWLDADDPRTLYSDTSGTTKATTDGTAVALWVDKSGNGRNASQSTAASRPAIKSAFTNGRNVLNFDGSNDTLTVPNSTSAFKFLHSTTSTVFIVVQYKATGTYRSYFTTATSSVNVGYIIFTDTNNTTYLPWMAGGVGGSLVVANQSAASYIDATQPYLVCVASDPTNATAVNRATGFKNGAAPYKNNISTLAASTANSTYDLAIGSEGGAYFANVYIAEILAYNSLPTASQRIQVETYLNNKWGLWASFNPSSISGLQLWLDSSDSGTLFQDSAGVIPAINDGDPVGYWKDKSGNSRNFIQSTAANRPSLKTSIQNSKNIIRFDGSNDFIQPSGYAVGPQPVTVFTVFKTNGTGYHNIYDTAGSNPMMWIDGSGQIEFDVNGYRSSSVLNTTTLVSYVNASSGGIITINGVTAISPYNVALSSGSTTFFNRSGGQTYKGDFYEMLIYNSALSTAQRQQVEQYLNQKWGIF